MPDRRLHTFDEAIDGIESGMTIIVGGFGAAGVPLHLLAAIRARGLTDLTVISNNAGFGGPDLTSWIEARMVRRVICSYPRTSPACIAQWKAGAIEIEVVPQGTLAERLRAGGAGIPAFFTPGGVGTQVALGGLPLRYAADGSIAVASKPKEVRSFDGSDYVLERAIVCDFALVHARYGDRHGNLVYEKSAQNFNPLCAAAGRVTIAEVEQVVEPGELDPALVHTPGVFVQRVVQVAPADLDKRIERRTIRA